MRDLTIGVYLLLAAMGAVLTLLPRRNPEFVAPFGAVLERVLADRAARVTIFVFWWWLGWHFLSGVAP